MIIKVRFHSSNTTSQTASNEVFQVDVNPNDDLATLKTIITLRYSDLDPELIDLMYQGKVLKSEMKCIAIKDELNADVIEVRSAKRSSCCNIM